MCKDKSNCKSCECSSSSPINTNNIGQEGRNMLEMMENCEINTSEKYYSNWALGIIAIGAGIIIYKNK